MGLTISNHKKSIDMGYGGFLNLRATISKLVPCQEFVDIYRELNEGYYTEWQKRGFKTREEYFEDYDKRVEEICVRNNLDEEVVNFLYRSDCDTASLSPKACRHLWWLIKDYDDNVLYGYCGRPDCAKFKDFKEIVRTCAEDRRVMRFS